jgi:hypothetical protein
MQYGGHLATLETLLCAGADLEKKDDEGHTALHFAASCRKEFCPPRVEILKALLAFDEKQCYPDDVGDAMEAAELNQETAGHHAGTRARFSGEHEHTHSHAQTQKIVFRKTRIVCVLCVCVCVCV